MARKQNKLYALTSNVSRRKSVASLPIKTIITTLKPRVYAQGGK